MAAWLCALLVAFSISVSSCKGKLPVPSPEQKSMVMTFKWAQGKCADNFIVYEDKAGIWVYVTETVTPRYRFELKPKEVRVLSVSGICMHGPDEGEWMSMEEVVAKR